jgi:hypothetical protein
MEYEPPTDFTTKTDVLEILKDSEIARIIEIANYRIQTLDPDDPLMDELIESSIAEVDNAIGGTYEGNEATVTGKLYTTDEESDADGESIIVQNKTLRYHGATVQDIRGVQEVVFAFYISSPCSHNPDEDPDEYVEEVYFALPNQLSKIEITLPETPDDVLFYFEQMSGRLIAGETFLSANADEKHRILDKIIADLNSALDKYKDHTLRIATQRYMSLYDDMPTFGLEDSLVDQTETPEDECYVPTGKCLGAIFAELIDQPDDAIIKDENFFFLGYGTPCVILRDSTRQRTYFVPLADIVMTTIVDDLKGM